MEIISLTPREEEEAMELPEDLTLDKNEKGDGGDGTCISPLYYPLMSRRRRYGP